MVYEYEDFSFECRKIDIIYYHLSFNFRLQLMDQEFSISFSSYQVIHVNLSTFMGFSID